MKKQYIKPVTTLTKVSGRNIMLTGSNVSNVSAETDALVRGNNGWNIWGDDDDNTTNTEAIDWDLDFLN